MNEENKCPICETKLVPHGATKDTIEIFNQWKPLHSFSYSIIQEHLEMNSNTTLYKCPNCQFEIYLPQIIGSKNFYQELQEDTSLHYYHDNKWDFIEALKEVRKCKEIIEIGCGPGSFLVKTGSIRACGTEYNDAALQKAKEKGCEVYGSDANLSDFREHFDAVFSFHVLEHVEDPLKFVTDISNYVKPGGMVCISVPNQNGPVKYLDSAVMNMPPHHSTHWQLKTFKELAKKMNYKLIRVAYEPLLVENFDYYSFYWANSFFNEQLFLHKIAKKILVRIMNEFFRLLIKFKINNFPLLRGQAIYVVFKKN